MRRLLVVVVIALGGFAAAFVAFGDAARTNCVLDGSSDPAYAVAFEQPVLPGQDLVLEITRDGQPVTGAWVCATLAPQDFPGAPVGAEGSPLGAGRYAVPLDLSAAGPWSGTVLVSEDGSPEVAVPVRLEVAGSPGPGPEPGS